MQMNSGRGSAVLTLLLLLLVAHPTSSTTDDGDVMDIIQLIEEVVEGVRKTWEIVPPLLENIDPRNNDMHDTLRMRHRSVWIRFREISKQIDPTVEKQWRYFGLAIRSITDLNHRTNKQLENQINEIYEAMLEIKRGYEEMVKLAARYDGYEIFTLLDVTQWLGMPRSEKSVINLINRLSILMLGSDENQNITESVLTQMASKYELSEKKICITKQSAQMSVYSLYASIAISELTGYTIAEFAQMLLRVYGMGNFAQEAELMRLAYIKSFERTLKLLKEVMGISHRIVYRCDPKKHVKGQTYAEVTRLLQGYIENEVDLNNDESCQQTCPFYQSTTSQGCFENKFCASQPQCTGRLYNCQFLDSRLRVCPSESNSTRRYEYIAYKDGRVLGQGGHCVRGSTDVNSWYRWIFWQCSYCLCLCDEEGLSSDRFFNLRESLADVKQNKVVTGLRFVKHNRVFHLQIQQAELLPRGNVNNASVQWKLVDNYNIFDRNLSKGRDYHTLSYESRSIDLDDINTDDQNYVVTGTRFRVVGAHLSLEVRLSKMDFSTGKLINPEENSFWKSENSGEHRQKLTLENSDISTRSIGKSIVISQGNQYIDFVNTGLSEDAAQTTVPFMDIQDVVSDPPVPLSGIGIYYKGRKGYGGFLAPKIITYDYTPFVRVRNNTTT